MDVAGLVVFLVMMGCLLKRTAAFPFENEDSEEDDSTPTTLSQMGRNLDQIPRGQFSITTANFAYNRIQELSFYVFYINFYRNLQNLELQHNRIHLVDPDAFKEMRQLNFVDMSNNNVTSLDPNTFKQNHRLEKLDLGFNNISFVPEKALLRSNSLENLILSHNSIIHVYDITFARLPNLHTLLLDSNPIYYISRNCFVHLRHLQYISLANTDVYRLTNSMFKTVPRLVDLSETPLGYKFTPSLKKVKKGQILKLMNLEGDSDESYAEDYDT